MAERRPSTSTIMVLVTLVALTAAATVAAIAADGPPPTTSTLPPTSVPIPTSTTTPGVVPTGHGPEAFTTTTAAGPLQVIVETVACVRYAGDGYEVRWHLENHSQAPAAGPLVGQLDKDGPVTLLALQITVPAGGREPGGPSTVLGSGDSVSLIWTVAGHPQVRSFPKDAASCPTDPADKRLATTTS